MLYANTDDGSSAVWVLNDDGTVVDNISIYGAERARILEQINEHYGTSFTGWSDNEIGLRYGSTLPNWNAYEKIGLPPIMLYKYKNPINQVWFFGEVENANAKIYGEDENTYFVLNDAGSIVGKNSSNVDKLKDEIKAAIEAKISESLQSISIVSTSYQLGGTVDNWDNYEIV